MDPAAAPNYHQIALGDLLDRPDLLARAYPRIVQRLTLRGIACPPAPAYPELWDAWHLIALLARVPPHIAQQGATTLEYAIKEDWPDSACVGPRHLRVMVIEAIKDATAAYRRWLMLMATRGGAAAGVAA